MKSQQLESQLGEIAFRKKLVRQQVEGAQLFNDEFDQKGIEAILKQRMQKTFEQITALREKGIPVSPYLEIGAERGQRSLVMENDAGATGAAVDLSYDMLKSCEYYQKVFNKKKMPARICCDANYLPLASNSMPFVFCYETLRHFPDPTPIIKEIHRVLAPGGCFFFDEEPYRRVLHLDLYESKKIYSAEYQNAGLPRKMLDFFFAKRSCNETEHGIIENDEIPLQTWKRALSVFDNKDIVLQSLKNHLHAELFSPNNYLKYFGAYLFGGNISGACRKSGVSTNAVKTVQDALICPSCLRDGLEISLTTSGCLCRRCNKPFPLFNGVVFLLPDDKLNKLYPEVFKSVC